MPEPAIAPAPETTPNPAATPTPEGDGLEAVFDNPFEPLDSKLKTPAPAAAPERKADDKAAPTTEKKPGDKVVEPAPEKKAAPVSKGLKEHNETLLNELKQERTLKASLEAKIKDYENRNLDTQKLSKKLADTESEMKRLNGELRAQKFSESESFTKTHVKPLEILAAKAKAQIEQLPIITGKDEGGNPVTRPATWADFKNIFDQGLGMSIIQARRLFGENSPAVEHFLNRLHEKVDARDIALQEERETWEKSKADEEAKTIRESEAISQMWQTVNDDIVKRNPTLFGEDPDDPEGNELLKEGYRIVDTAYGSNNLTPQQKVLLDANIRHRAAAHGRDQHRISKLTARVAELEEKLAGKKSSQPSTVRRDGDGGAGPQPSENPLLDDELANAFKE